MADFTERLQAAVIDRYRIERHLGEGGMATVHLAHDVKHDRKVALKVLRPELAAVIGAERFLAEIKTTANLQHPNILPLFDSGDADGQLFYVMPYVEGESLRDRIVRERQLPMEDVLRFGAEVASALDYAHRQGVIHRDIKPENILIHEGRALVADFGIALALSTAGGERMTETGMSVGTPHYMSPEQAMGGHDITARSDIYALGATVYEALVGEPPFTGPTAQAVIARLLTEDPRPLRTQRKTIPAHVEAAVLTALQRLPADRFGTAAEFGDALEGKVTLATRMTGTAAAREGAGAKVSRGGTLTLGGIVAALAAAALWGWLRPASPPPVSREAILLGPLAFEFLPVVAQGAAVAPDGSAIVYFDTVGGDALWIKERGELDGRRLAPITNLISSGSPPGPAFSPDGRWIGYADGKLLKVAREGGAPVVVSDSSAAQAVAWLDDGTIVFPDGNVERLFRVSDAGGPATQVLTGASAGGPFVQLAPVPGAEAVLVGVAGVTSREVVLDLETGAVHELSRGAVGAWMVPGGELVYAQATGSLFAASFDRKSLALNGPPVSVLDGVRVYGTLADVTVGADGTILYVEGGVTSSGGRLQTVSIGRDGTATPLDTTWSATVAGNGGLALSPDGTRLALTVTDSVNGRGDLYVLRLPEGPATRLTFQGANNIRPSWSSDGETILYASDRGGQMELWSRRADGSGQPERVVSEERPVWEGLWSPDGDWIVFRTDDVARGRGDILAVRTSGDTTPVPLVATEAEETGPALSPDGRWLAYASNVSGRKEVYVRPFPDVQDGLWQVSTDGGAEPLWSDDGRELFYRSAEGRMMVAEVSGDPTFVAGVRTMLFDSREYARNDDNHYYDVTPDGERFVMLRPEALRAPRAEPEGRLVLVRNWLPELRAKLKK